MLRVGGHTISFQKEQMHVLCTFTTLRVQREYHGGISEESGIGQSGVQVDFRKVSTNSQQIPTFSGSHALAAVDCSMFNPDLQGT